MKVYLAVCLRYYDDELIRENLMTFNSVKELDEFTKKFHNSNEIRMYFQDEIQCFLLDYRNHPKYKETKDSKPISYITTYSINEKNGWRFIDTFYKDSDKIVILTINDLLAKMSFIVNHIKCYKYIINGYLTSDDIKEYLRALGIFRISLSQEEIYYLKKYISGVDDSSLEKVLLLLKRQLLKLPEDKRYTSLRFKKDDLEKYELSFLRTYNLKQEVAKDEYEIVDGCKDDFFVNLVQTKNYEDMFKYYELDEIVKYTKNKINGGK